MYNIAVTGLNASDSPAPGVAVVRSMREHPDFKGRIIGLGYDALESGILDEGMVDTAYLLPYPRSGKEVLLERLLYIHEREKIDAIIPNLDSELGNFIQLRGDLEEQGIKLYIPSEEQFTRRAKMNLGKLAKDTGIKTPFTRVIGGPDELKLAPDEYPVMVKGQFYESYLAHSHAEALYFLHRIAATWGYPVLVQEYVRGEEFNAAAIGDGEGGISGIACMKKLVFTDKGKGWACISIRNAKLEALAEKIVAELRWRGPMEVEALYSEKDGDFYLIEINPRFPAWIYLAKAAGGNLPHMLLQMALTGTPPARTECRAGVVFSNYTVNLITELSRIETLFTTGEVSYEKTV